MTYTPIRRIEENARLSEQLSVHRSRRRAERAEMREDWLTLLAAVVACSVALGLLVLVSF